MRSFLPVLVLAAVAARSGFAEPLPPDAGAINVRDYGAVGDGRHDDTEALLKAIAASGPDTGRTFWQDRPVYLPNGTYLVSAPLLKRYADGRFASGMMLIGQSQAQTIIRLADKAPGYDDAANPKAVVFTTSKQVDGTPTSGGKDYPRLGEGNDAYMNFVEDLTIDVGAGNPGAIGIDYLANNIGALRDVTVKAPSGSGSVGLSMIRKWPGPALIQNLTVEGFDTGISVAQTEYGLTFDHIRLNGQRAAAVRNDQNALALHDLTIEGAAKALVNSGDKGLIALQGGRIPSAPDAAIQNAGIVIARGVQFGSSSVSGVFQAGKPPRSEEQSHPSLPDAPRADAEPLTRWAKVASAGDQSRIATEALRSALKSGAATVYLPHGTYLIDDAVEIPATVRRIVGMNSTIRVSPQRRPAFARDGGMFKIGTQGQPLSIEGLAFDNTNQGAQLAVEITGKRDVGLKDIVSAGVTLLNRRAQGGRVFLEDVCCGRMEIAGPDAVIARQFDTEGAGVRIADKGSPLTILGLKTEGISTIVDASNGAVADIFGGLVYMVRDPQGAPPPAFHAAGGQLTASFAEEVLRPENRYRTFLMQDGATSADAEAFPERGLGRFVIGLSSGGSPAEPSQPTQ
jgi:hypothetical protein